MEYQHLGLPVIRSSFEGHPLSAKVFDRWVGLLVNFTLEVMSKSSCKFFDVGKEWPKGVIRTVDLLDPFWERSQKLMGAFS